jgi:hypothetical protein
MSIRVLYYSIVVFFAVVLYSCTSGTKRYIPKVEKNELPDVKIKIKRYGAALFSIDTSNVRSQLKKIKNNYLLFLDADLDNAENINQIKSFITDTVNISIYKKTKKVFPKLDKTEKSLSKAYSYLKYYYPDYYIQQFYSYISGIYYEQPVMVYDTFALIGLDNYLGRSCRQYDELFIPKYRSRWMIPEEIPVDVMNSVFETLPKKNFKPVKMLDMMVNAGKRMFFLDAVMPDTPDTLKIKYTKSQLKWVEKNEKNIWSFLISEKLLFTADFKQINKLMNDGPFTKGFPSQAPSRLGEWIGWQIISSFMKNNSGVSLNDLMQTTDSQYILQKSKYKP